MTKFNLIKKWHDKKSLFLCFGFFLLAFFLFYPFPAASAWWDTIVSGLTYIPYAMIGAIFILAVTLSQAFSWLMGYILDVVMSPSFVSLSYTNPATNQIIKSGLNITQSFVNLLLVLALVYTALSLALRLNETQAKKMLARLIIVALLVNFAPVFCGLVVDVTNIVMYYFLKPISEGVSGVLTQVGPYVDVLIASLKTVFSGLSERMGVLMMALTQITVNIAMGLAFFLFAGIFLVRYVAIWTLVILAPIAFVAWVFPPGRMRAFWDMWLKNFIEWSIIGIPLAFFLYLAMGSFSLITAAFQQKMTMPGIEPAASGFFNEVFPYFVVIVFLYLGFILGLQTSALGASGAISLTKKYGKKGGMWIGSETRRLAGRIAGARGGRVKEWMQRQAATPYPGKTLLGKAAWTAGTLGIAPAYWALRRGAGEAGIYLTEAGRKDIRGGEKKYEGTIAADKVAAMRDVRLGWAHRIAALRKAIEEEQIKDIKKLGITDEEITAIGEAALRVHPDEFKSIRDAFPHLAKDMGKGFSETIQKPAKVNLAETLAMKDKQGKPLYSGIMERIMAEMKTAQVPKMDSSTLFGPTKIQAVFEAAQKNWQAGHWAEAGRAFGKEFCDGVREEILTNLSKFTPSAQKYFTASPAGRSLYGI